MRISLILFLRKIHAISFVVASLNSRWISQISFLIMFQVSKDTWSLIRTRSISGLYLFTMREEGKVMSRLYFVDPSRRKGSSCRVNTRRRPSNYSSRSTIWSSPRFFTNDCYAIGKSIFIFWLHFSIQALKTAVLCVSFSSHCNQRLHFHLYFTILWNCSKRDTY